MARQKKWQNEPFVTKWVSFLILFWHIFLLDKNSKTVCKRSFLIRWLDKKVTKWTLCDEMNVIFNPFLTYFSIGWKCKDFFVKEDFLIKWLEKKVTKWNLYDESNTLWRNECHFQSFFDTFFYWIKIERLLVKEVFWFDD